MDRRYLAGLVAGALVGTTAGMAAGVAVLRTAGADPSGQTRRLIDHLDRERREALLERDQYRRELMRARGGFATLPGAPAGKAALPGDSEADRLPPQQLPTTPRDE